eukprot:m51a1_g9218 putative glutamate 5-kinase (294) ;mRNA; r:57631-58784
MSANTNNEQIRSTPPLSAPLVGDLTVIKTGTGCLTRPDGTLDRAAVLHLVTAIAGLMHDGHRCLFVSSGAVGSGVPSFGLKQYPRDTATRQACAAVGQARLMNLYGTLFDNYDITVAQVLLTTSDVGTEERQRNVRDTLYRLLSEPNVLPIINENDTVSVAGLKFADNDMLSYHVARLVDARRLVLLSTVDGLIDPATGAVVDEVEYVEEVMGCVQPEDKGKLSIGGMLSKLTAVKLAVDAGIDTHIAAGRKPDRLPGIIAGQSGLSTHFCARKAPAQQQQQQQQGKQEAAAC